MHAAYTGSMVVYTDGAIVVVNPIFMFIGSNFIYFLFVLTVVVSRFRR